VSTWLLVVGLAFAKKPVEPAVDRAALDEAEALACARDVPENYQIHTGYASDPDPAAAITAALQAARKEALDTLCAGKSEARCAVMRRHVEGWKKPFHHPVTQRACAHVGVHRQWIDDDRHDQEQLADDLASMARRVAEAVGEAPVALAPLRWADSGCDAGEVGATLRGELHDALAEARRRLVAPGAEGAALVTLRLELTGEQVRVSALIDPPKGGGSVPVKGLSFPADLFAVEGASRDCRLDRQLGLENGRRVGAGELRVWLDDGVDSTVCEGTTGEPQITVSRPARVKVWSVDREGTAYLVWPPPGSEGLVNGTVSLGEVTYHRPAAGGEERLLAVAVPQGTPFGTVDRWTGFCKHPGPFDASAYPKVAAAAASSLTVLPFDTPFCAQKGRGAVAAPTLPEIPICPERLGGP
jgi:hypothetical protein